MTLGTRLVWGLEAKVSPGAELDQLRGAGALSGQAYFPGLRVAVEVFPRLGSAPPSQSLGSTGSVCALQDASVCSQQPRS